MGPTRIGSQTDRRVRNNFGNMYITGLEKAGVDCLGDASEKGRVFAPFDSIPDGSQWEGFCCQNTTNVEGDEGMGGTMAKQMILPSAGKATEVQKPIPLNFAWSYPASVADSTDTGNAKVVEGGIETTKEDWHKVRAANHTKEICKTDYQTNYQWHHPAAYGIPEPKTYHNNTVEKVEQNHQAIQPEPAMQVGSPTQQYESKGNELPTEEDGESYKIGSIASETWDDSNVDVPEEEVGDSVSLPTTTLTKQKEDVMDKGIMTSRLSDVISIEGNYDEKPDIGDKCGEIKQTTADDHVIDGSVDPHSSSESQIFPRIAYDYLNYAGSAPHTLPTFHKRGEEDNVARLLCTPGYSAGRGLGPIVGAAYLCRLRDAIDQSKRLVRTSEVAELCSLRKPPPSIVKLFYGLCRVLGIPRMKWMSLRMFFLRNRSEIVQAIHNLDVDSPAVNCNNLAFCDEQWAQLSNISKASSATHCISAWLHLLYAYTRAKDGYIVTPSPFEAAPKPRHAQITSSPSSRRRSGKLSLGGGKERPKAERSSCLIEKTPTGSITITTNTPVVQHNNMTSHDDPIIAAEGFAQVSNKDGRDDKPEEIAAPGLPEEDDVDENRRQIQTSNAHTNHTTPIGLTTSATANAATPTLRGEREVQSGKQIKISKSYTRSKPKDTILTTSKQGDQILEKQGIKISNKQHPHVDKSTTEGVILLHKPSSVRHNHQYSKTGTTWPHYANPVARPTYKRFNPILNNPRFPPEQMKYSSEYNLNFTWPRDGRVGWTSQDPAPGTTGSQQLDLI